MAFFFFLLVNATLFVRPMEIVPDLEGVRLYEFFILASLFFAIPEILTFFGQRPLGAQPITLCVFGLLVMTLLSKAGESAEVLRHGEHFLKIVIYYLLAVSLINSGARLRVFLVWLLICVTLLTSLTLLQYHEVIQLPKVNAKLKDGGEPETGALTSGDLTSSELTPVYRLQGTGIFSDPNEFCGMLAAAVPLCLWALTGRRGWRALWLVLLALMLYGIYETRSRGGFLSLVAGLGMLTAARFGLGRTLLAGAIGLPLLLLLFGGRQTEISAFSGTAKTRIQHWSDWLSTFRENPVAGAGLNLPPEESLGIEKEVWQIEHLAHNSYLQAFADWGFLGGTLFLGAFILSIWALARYRPSVTTILDPHLRRLQPFLLGTLVAYAVGIGTISMSDRVPTYLMLALDCAFPFLARSYPSVEPPRVTGKVSAILLGSAVAFLAATYVFVRVFINW